VFPVGGHHFRRRLNLTPQGGLVWPDIVSGNGLGCA
jgi:hypothetical protein